MIYIVFSSLVDPHTFHFFLRMRRSPESYARAWCSRLVGHAYFFCSWYFRLRLLGEVKLLSPLSKFVRSIERRLVIK
jgi:hypothetical protein